MNIETITPARLKRSYEFPAALGHAAQAVVGLLVTLGFLIGVIGVFTLVDAVTAYVHGPTRAPSLKHGASGFVITILGWMTFATTGRAYATVSE